MKHPNSSNFIRASFPQAQNAPGGVFAALCAGCCTAAVMGALCAVGGIGFWPALLCGILGALFTLSGKKALRIGLPILAAAVLLLHGSMLEGLYAFGNRVLDILTLRFRLILLRFPEEQGEPLRFLLPLGILLALLLSRRRGTVFCWIGITLGLALGLFREGWIVEVLALGTLFACLTERPRITHAGVLAICVGLALVLGAAVGQLPEGRETLSRRIHTLRYDQTTNSMPEGQLKNLAPWKKTDTPALAVTMEQPQKLYLRGFVGEEYTGNAWESGEITREDSDLFYWLHAEGFYGQTVLAQADAQALGTAPVWLTVENLSACEARGYVPNGLADSTRLDSRRIGDEIALPGTAARMSMVPGSVPDYYKIQGALANQQEAHKAFLAKEQAYRDYVYAHDLSLTAEAAAGAQALFGTPMQGKSLSEIRLGILEALEENLTYDETVYTWNGDWDFLRYVRQINPKGYSVHYATAAVLMLRSCGVPARYAEGYYLPPAQAKTLKPGERTILTEENAHAWAEYYLDGVGWVPFEVTPGYIDPEELEFGGEAGDKRYENPQLSQLPVVQPELPQLQQRQSFRFGFRWQMLLLLPVLLLAAAAVLLFRRRRLLLRRLHEMDTAEPRESVTLRYGYALFLLDRAPELTPEGGETAAELNREAMFSSHRIGPEQADWMADYCRRVLSEYRASRPRWKRLYERFILCIVP